MKKLLAALAITIGLAACGNNGNPSGTPSSDSNNGSLSVPDTSSNNTSSGQMDSSAQGSMGSDTATKAH